MNPRMDVAIIAVILLPETQIVREGLAFALEGRHRNTLWQDSRWWRQRALQSYQQVRPFDTGWSHRCAFQGNDRRGGLAYTTNRLVRTSLTVCHLVRRSWRVMNARGSSIAGRSEGTFKLLLLRHLGPIEVLFWMETNPAPTKPQRDWFTPYRRMPEF